jgi:NitT/TauT family transport system substrate-binding protein
MKTVREAPMRFARMKFAKFMRRVGAIKHEPASWKDMFFPEIGGLNGS